MEFSAVNTIWVLIGAALVFFMQAGFAMVETGETWPLRCGFMAGCKSYQRA